MRQSPNFAIVSPFSTTVALLCDSLTFLRQCGQGLRCHLKPCPVSTLSQKNETVAEKCDCRRIRRQSPFSATVSLLCDSLTFLLQCGHGLMRFQYVLSNKQVFSTVFCQKCRETQYCSSTQLCRQSVPRRRAAHSERATTKNRTFLSADCHSRVPLTEERSCRLPAKLNDDSGTESQLR